MNDNVAKAIASLIVTAKELEGIPVYLHGKLVNPPKKQLQSKTMTHKDLRDIAAYWGAPYQFELLEGSIVVATRNGYENKDGQWQVKSGHVCGGFLDDILSQVPFRDLKLHLRFISSLTDEEVKHIVSIDSSYPYKAESLSIRRSDNQIYFDTDAGINEWGLLYTGKHRGQIGFHSYAEAQVFAYLQSLHVYVPGTIDEQFVKLI